MDKSYIARLLQGLEMHGVLPKYLCDEVREQYDLPPAPSRLPKCRMCRIAPADPVLATQTYNPISDTAMLVCVRCQIEPWWERRESALEVNPW